MKYFSFALGDEHVVNCEIYVFDLLLKYTKKQEDINNDSVQVRQFPSKKR